MGDAEREEEVERSTAAIPGHVLDHSCQAVAPDEERERLVLVRRPRHQLVHEECRCRNCDGDDREPEAVCSHPGPRRSERRAA